MKAASETKLLSAPRVAALATLYVVTGHLGLMASPVAGFATLVWAPSGISLALLVLWGRRMWPGVFLGSTLVNFWAGASVPAALGIGTGATLEAVVACWLLQKSDFRPNLGRVLDVFTFAAFGSGSAFVSASVGVGTLWLGGQIESGLLARAWLTWAMGDLMSNLVVAPLILSWCFDEQKWTFWRKFEGLILAACIVAVGIVAYYRMAFELGSTVYYLFRPYTLFPFLIWASLRFGPRGATTSIAIVLAVSFASVLLGPGPIKDGTIGENLVFAQYFTLIAALTAYVLAAVVRSREATEHALRKAKEHAVSANLAKSAFLANMSHEIRTPLSVILGFSEFLSDKGQSEDERIECVNTIQRNGNLLLRLVDDILDFSKIEAGRLEIENIEFSLAPLLRDLEDFFRLMAQEKGIALKVDFANLSVTDVVADPTRLKQILINMVSNAIKFTHRGEVAVSVSNSAIQPKTRRTRLEFIVQDTGIGVPAHQTHRLFQPFVQADSSTNRRFGGTGLGLVLGRDLARSMGGDLELVESTEGQGSTFRLWLEVSAREPFDGTSKVEAACNLSKTALKDVHVLVVEDAADNRLLARKILEHAGATVSVAEGGNEGVKRALQGGIDLVLMDLQMPGIDGYEATQILQTMRFDRPIVALTANALAADSRTTENKGFAAHLTKPIDAKKLIRTISRCVPRSATAV